MKRFILLTISFVCINTIFCQTRNDVQTEPQRIWSAVDISEGGGSFLIFNKENIQSQPENIKAVIAYFANKYFHKEEDKQKLAKLLGFSSIEVANKALSEKWIIDTNIIRVNRFDGYLSILRKDNEVVFFSNWRQTDGIVFEINKDGKMIFKERYKQ